MAGESAGKIFINYRRGDDPGFARSLFDRLKGIFGEERLFMDVDTLGATNDFAAVLDREIRACSVLLVMIGKNWLGAADDKGRRLGRADDFVTGEIALALRLGKLVMPILVNGVPPLKEDDLPPILHPLVPCNAFPLANDRFEGDVHKIVRTIARHFGWSDAHVAGALLHGSQLHQGKPLEIWLAKWKFIEDSSNPNDFIEFLRSKPPQELAQLAAKVLERLNWRHVGMNPNIETLEWFLQNHPSGEYASQARQKAQQLRTEARLKAEREAQDKRDVELRRQQDKRDVESRRQEEKKDRIAKITNAVVASVTLTLFIGGGGALISARTPGALIWRQINDESVHTFWHTDSVLSVAFSPDGRTVLSGSWDETLKLWDVATGKKLRTFRGHERRVVSVAFSPDGRTALSGCADDTLKLWDVATGKELRTLWHLGYVVSVAFSPDGRTAFSGRRDDTLNQWDVATGQELRTFKGPPNDRSLIYHDGSVVISLDGRTALFHANDGTLELWDVATGKVLRTFKGLARPGEPVAISPDGRTVLSSAADNALKLWDAASGKELSTFKASTERVSLIAIFPDGRTVLSGSIGGTLKLWDVASGEGLRTLTGHTSEVNSVAFSPDGRTLASASGDKTIKLWDVSSYTTAAR